MREPIRDKGRLEHILEAIGNVNEFTKGVSYDDLENNKMLTHAVVHNIQVIGEASYKLTKEFCKSHPEVEWADIIGLRHVLVHDYYNIRIKEVWNIIQQDLPPLQKHIEDYLAEME